MDDFECFQETKILSDLLFTSPLDQLVSVLIKALNSDKGDFPYKMYWLRISDDPIHPFVIKLRSVLEIAGVFDDTANNPNQPPR